jgi:rhodanese-related sulfurtransferase
MISDERVKMVVRAFVIVFFSALVGGIANTISPHGIPFVDSSSFSNKKVARIDLEKAWVLFRQKGVIFVDARDTEEFKQGHIKGALSLPIGNFDHQGPLFKDLVPSDTSIITYCDGIGCESSLELAEVLLDSGYKDVKVFYGGWREWKDTGHPVEKGAAGP